MCLALYKPAKATLNKAEMQSAFKSNPDGAGFAYYDPALRRVEIQRGYFTFDALWHDLEPIMEDKCPLILHFRWATHGDVNVENCHPFALKDGALIHNGVISGMGTKTSYSKYYTTTATNCDTECGDDRSDTREFVEDFLAGMNVNVLRSAKKLIEHTIGYSKLVTIHNDGSVIIFNEQMGHWRGGVWYSNDSYKPYKAASANPANLVPTKYDYYGKSTKTADYYYSPTTESSVYDDGDFNVLTMCPTCLTDVGHDIVHNHTEDCFILSCVKCNEVWEIDGKNLDNEEYDFLLEAATKMTLTGV